MTDKHQADEATEPQVSAASLKVFTRSDLSAEQVEVVDRLVYAWSESSNGAWPIFQWLERDIDVNCGLDLEPVLRSLNPDLVQYDHYAPQRPDAVVALAIPGLACAVNPPATSFLNLFMKSLKWALRRYDLAIGAVAPDRSVSVEVSAAMAREDWMRNGGEATPIVLARAGEMLGREPGISVGRNGPSAASRDDWTMVLARDIRQYRRVKTLIDYLAIRAERYGRWVGRAAEAAPSGAQLAEPGMVSSSARARDIFLSYASEDKAPFVDDLYGALVTKGFSVWYDNFELHVGDSLRESIDDGLRSSHYGVVILSRAFFSKRWPKAELDALVGKMQVGQGRILPVLHNMSPGELAGQSPLLAGRLAADSAHGAEDVARQIANSIDRDRRPARPPT